MKIYQRITHHGGYDTITTVTEAGGYHHISVWPDGFRYGEHSTTLQNMGWKSTDEFLSSRKGFTIIGEEETA